MIRKMSNFRPRWNDIEHVLLDMDGTILDLAFDNYFWSQLVPERFAQARGVSLEEAKAELWPQFKAIEHTLPWYCTDHWSRVTGLNLAELKREVREHVAFIGGSRDFLDAVKASGRPLWLVTNAHRDSWQIKLEQVGLTPMFDAIISSHDYGAPKEDQRFWESLQREHPFDRRRALFADDSLPVLRSARTYGIGQIVAMRRPDSTAPEREISEFESAEGLGALLPL